MKAYRLAFDLRRRIKRLGISRFGGLSSISFHFRSHSSNLYAFIASSGFVRIELNPSIGKIFHCLHSHCLTAGIGDRQEKGYQHRNLFAP